MTDLFRTAMQEISVAGQVRSSHDDAGPTSWGTTENPLRRTKATTATRANSPTDGTTAHLGSGDL